jgi:hypothetical protein
LSSRVPRALAAPLPERHRREDRKHTPTRMSTQDYPQRTGDGGRNGCRGAGFARQCTHMWGRLSRPTFGNHSSGVPCPAEERPVLAWRCLFASHDWRYGANLGLGPNRWCRRCGLRQRRTRRGWRLVP